MFSPPGRSHETKKVFKLVQGVTVIMAMIANESDKSGCKSA